MFLAFIRLGSTSLWLDEIMSLDFCDSGIRDLFKDLMNDVHAPAYYLILYFFVKIGGITELVGRIPGILAGAGTILALWSLAKELQDRHTSLIAALLLAISPFFLEFSREIHPYSLSALLSVLSWLYFIRILKKGRKISILLYAIFSGLLLLTFYPSFLIIVSQFLYFCALHMAKRKKKGIMTAWIVTMLIFSLWMPVFIRQLQVNKISHDVEVYFPQGIKPHHVQRLLGDIFLGTGRQDPGSGIWGIPLVILIIPSFFLIIKNRKYPGYKQYLILWIFWGVILLFTILCLIKPIYLSRYMTMSAPFACLFLAAALDRIRGKWKYLLLTILISGGLFSYWIYLGKMPRENWRDPAGYLVTHTQPLDVIVTDHVNSTSCLIFYFKILGRAELNQNTFTFEQFLQHTRGEYRFSDRTLWYLSKTPGENRQLKLIRSKNTPLAQKSFKKDFTLHSFKGKD